MMLFAQIVARKLRFPLNQLKEDQFIAWNVCQNTEHHARLSSLLLHLFDECFCFVINDK